MTIDRSSSLLGSPAVETAPARNLVLILGRQLASNLAVPVFLVDERGTLAFYNEAAEVVLGSRYAETGELSRDEWGTMWNPEYADGTPIPLEKLPLTIALAERRPAHCPMVITGLDGARRSIRVTALPLFAKQDEFVGAMAIFWENEAG